MLALPTTTLPLLRCFFESELSCIHSGWQTFDRWLSTALTRRWDSYTCRQFRGPICKACYELIDTMIRTRLKLYDYPNALLQGVASMKMGLGAASLDNLSGGWLISGRHSRWRAAYIKREGVHWWRRHPGLHQESSVRIYTAPRVYFLESMPGLYMPWHAGTLGERVVEMSWSSGTPGTDS